MKRDEVERFEGRWLKGPPSQILARIDALAHRHGCWVQLWCNPCASMGPGWLFWLETHAVGANDRIQAFQYDMLNNPELHELREWFLYTSKEQS